MLALIGRITVDWSRPIEGTPQTGAVAKEAEGWSVAFSCAQVPVQPLPPTGQETGIDLGLDSCAPRANRQPIVNSRHSPTAEASLRRCQRRLARRTTGRQRRRKAVTLLARAPQHVRRQRQDFPHKEALKLVRSYDPLAHEDVPVRTLVKNHPLAKRLADAGWGAFLASLTVTAASAGKRVVAGNPACTSHAGSGGGVLVEKGWSVRWHACPDCGTSRHRDQNAALNILRLGQLGPKHRGPGYGPRTPTWPVGASVVREPMGLRAPVACQRSLWTLPQPSQVWAMQRRLPVPCR